MKKINEQLLFPHNNEEMQQLLEKLNKSNNNQFHNVFSTVNSYPDAGDIMKFSGLYAIKYSDQPTIDKTYTNHTALCLGDGTVLLEFNGKDSAVAYNELANFIAQFSGAGAYHDKQEIKRAAAHLESEYNKENVEYNGDITTTEDYKKIVEDIKNVYENDRIRQYNKIRKQLLSALVATPEVLEKMPVQLFEYDRQLMHEFTAQYEAEKLEALEGKKTSEQEKGVKQINKDLKEFDKIFSTIGAYIDSKKHEDEIELN